ncbi:DUF262 domain-containing protein [Mesobacillus subterraneus]|uniref:DUF262 domain-containing protein n=1 Tax=Mesobacillus subterraneus TaxID=285983 RepID=A0A3R9E765_9BACI|nr:DUF262 domain-containing protein [Mesobacillus subterraneus]RSD27630.1 DUF262 domain-containing protein [Mesobacillus subterraneus]
MSFQTPITIKEAISKIDKKEYLLPSIQREFVWKNDQIERLFDSIMKGYPVGAFLFWAVSGENVNNYQFYEFIREYHEKDNRHNPKANLTGVNSLTAILDGQQRLTSLYVGLKGTFAVRAPYKRIYEKKKLYLNLLKPSERLDYRYDFRFLSEKELGDFNQNEYLWFPVGEILNFNDFSDIFRYITSNSITDNFASECLTLLFQKVNVDGVINYFLETSKELDKVLNIFIRVNSGGTPLSYSDLLLSIATAQWKNEDARETITHFVDELNDFGDGFDFDKDLVLKACLVLSDFSDITFKVDNFNSTNMKIIENNWDQISTSLKLAVELVSSFGYNFKTLTANYVIIPIAYYVHQKGNPKNIVQHPNFQKVRTEIKKFTIVSLLKRIFGGQPDNVLRPMREIIKNMQGDFSFDELKNNLRITNKSLKIDVDDINDLMYTKYGNKYAFSLLSLLYPTLDYRNNFHQDHIFPKSILKSKSKLRKLGLNEQSITFCNENVDYIGNIQLLEGTPNIIKSDTPFENWINDTFSDQQEKLDYMKKHHIPIVQLNVGNFEEFLKEREKIMIAELKKILL